MSKALELFESRVSQVTSDHGSVTVHFPYAYIHKARGLPGRDPGSGWGQEVELLLEDATIQTRATALPSMIDEGYFEVDGERYEVIPLPLGEHVTAHLHLLFSDGGELDVEGKNPVIKLIGRAIPLEDYS